MSQSLNIIETSEIDKSRELDGIIPESTYYHSTGIVQRHHSKLSPVEGNLISESASSSMGVQYNWIINPTPNSVLNLNEMFFEVVGKLKITAEFSSTASSDNLVEGKTYKVMTEDLLIPSDLWLHSAFSNIELKIGDASITNITNPIVYNIFRKLMFRGEEKDDISGFAGTHEFKFSKDLSDTIKDVDFTEQHNDLYNFSSGSIHNKLLTFKKSEAVGDGKDVQYVDFSFVMCVSDLFDTDDLLPIFNQRVKLSLQRTAFKDISIQPAHQKFSVEIASFKHFQLNCFQYLLDAANSSTLMNIYSQPKTVVFSAKTQVFQTVTNIQPSTQVTINSPTGLLFGAKFLMLYLTKSNTTNNVIPKLTFDSAAADNKCSILKLGTETDNVYTLKRTPITKLKASRYPSLYMGPHTALNVMYNNINIGCDNYTVLYDDVTPLISNIKDNTSEKTAACPQIYYDLSLSDTSGDSTVIRPYYNRIYHEYCESCKHTGVVPMSREEYLNCYPVIMTELSDFSKLSTNSFLNITINNNQNYTDTEWKSPYKIDGNNHNQMNVLCYGLRALQMSNGYARIMEVDNTITNNMEDTISTTSS